MTDAEYWKRAFLAASRWPYSGLKRDLDGGAVRDPDQCKPQYCEDFATIKAARKRAALEERFPTTKRARR